MAKIIRQGDGKYSIRTSKYDRLLHIETSQGIINIHLNLTETTGNPVTNISIIPDASDVNGSPINVVIDNGTTIQKEPTSIRLILDKAGKYKQKQL